jgi:low temperature requirement protein LtrA
MASRRRKLDATAEPCCRRCRWPAVARLVIAWAGVLPSFLNLLLFAGLVALEPAVPGWAERTGPTNWHPHHIAERYSPFTVILLGESVLATSTGVRNALATATASGSLVGVAAAGFVLLCALWWLYLLQPAGDGLAQRRHRSYLWGYGHYGLFASLAALGSGLKIAAEQTAHPLAISPVVTGYAVAAPAGPFVLLLWIIHRPIVPDPVLGPAVTSSGVAAISVAPLVLASISGAATASSPRKAASVNAPYGASATPVASPICPPVRSTGTAPRSTRS